MQTPQVRFSKLLSHTYYGVVLCGIGVMIGSSSTVYAIDPVAANTDAATMIQDQLAAGEFVPAFETAMSEQDTVTQNELLKVIANKSAANGHHQSANVAIRQMSTQKDRVSQRSNDSAQKVLNGGQANFGPLMALITNETSGPWEEEDGTGGTITPFITGVHVDPQGMMNSLSRTDLNHRLENLQQNIHKTDLNCDVSKASNLRMVSLTRLEQEVAQQLAEGRTVVDTMQNLAGLTHIKYVFFYPETGEVVIAGPAEGWNYDQQGFSVGSKSKHPTMQLDDLVTLMRTFSDRGMKTFGCSINTRPEGVKELKEFAEKSQASGPLAAGSVNRWAKTLQEKLGLQDIVVYGVPADSRVARVLVEADYRMKLIGVGKLEGGSDIPSYFELIAKQTQSTGSLDALRWWLSLKCEQIIQNPDHTAFEIRGSNVLCQSENQFVNNQGEHLPTGKAEETNRQFAANFTAHYDQLAQKDVVFADLQNVFDLAYVAALIYQNQEAGTLDWNADAFVSTHGYQTGSYATPKVVNSVVNHRVFNQKDIVVQVAGGVQADVLAVVNQKEIQQETARMDQVAASHKAPQLPARRWWWDMAE
jgi:hypothetical protein